MNRGNFQRLFNVSSLFINNYNFLSIINKIIYVYKTNTFGFLFAFKMGRLVQQYHAKRYLRKGVKIRVRTFF